MINETHKSTLKVEEFFDHYDITLKCDCWEKECDNGLKVHINDGDECRFIFTDAKKFNGQVVLTLKQAIELADAIKRNVKLMREKNKKGLTDADPEVIAAFRAKMANSDDSEDTKNRRERELKNLEALLLALKSKQQDESTTF